MRQFPTNGHHTRAWAVGLLVWCGMILRAACGADVPSPGELKQHIPELAESRQAIVVIAKDWNSIPAQLQCFERATAAAPWKEALTATEAVVGKNGLGWGIGLHGTHPPDGVAKREGDRRAPAGIFRLREAFGYAPFDQARIGHFPYQSLNETTEGVDDSDSKYYNRVVDAALLRDKDWKSSEKMRRADDLYRWGVVVEHNGRGVPMAGSCIFLHVWKGRGQGTVGCTAMPAERIEEIVRWLDKARNPVLVQLPDGEYRHWKQRWGLP